MRKTKLFQMEEKNNGTNIFFFIKLNIKKKAGGLFHLFVGGGDTYHSMRY